MSTMTEDRIFVIWDVEGRRLTEHIAADKPYSLQHVAMMWTVKYGRKFTVKTLAEARRLMAESKSAQEARSTEPKEDQQ